MPVDIGKTKKKLLCGLSALGKRVLAHVADQEPILSLKPVGAKKRVSVGKLKFVVYIIMRVDG